MSITRDRLILALAVFALSLPAPALAGEGAGVAAADFMEIPVGARGLAMGGAGTSLPGDMTALFLNPALLAGDAGYRLHMGHQVWYQGLQHESAVLGLGLPQGWGRVALHARYLHMEPLPAYNAELEAVGEVDVYDLAMGMSWARRFHRRLDLGVSAHNVREYLAGDEGWGWAWDVGLGLVGAGFYWSASARNLSGGMNFGSEQFAFDREYSLGAARYFPHLGAIVSMEYRQPQFWGGSVRSGAEYMVNERLVLRAGYAHTLDLEEAAGQPSFGAGLNLGAMGLDYAFQMHEQLGEVHSIGLRLMGSGPLASPYRFFRPSI
jgi:hypothetical protein